MLHLYIPKKLFRWYIDTKNCSICMSEHNPLGLYISHKGKENTN
jgi:hypothetical protein